MALQAGTRVGPYEIVAPIGRGGMGEVYRARDPRLDRLVAVKVLPDSVSSDHDRIARFEREARALATLNHPNIAAIHGLEEVPATGLGERPATALILEFVEGGTLEDHLRQGPLPFADALAIARQIADALDAAHEKGIVHRDLKPANVKITPAGVVKILDFGLAKIAADMSPGESALTIASTGTNVILGTPAYMAPEQAQGRTVDKRADIWAFGVLLYEMLAGTRPFGGASVQETLAAVLTTDPDWDRVPPQVRPLLRRCLERDPRKRLRDIGDFTLPIQPTAITVPDARPSRVWLLAASVVALAALIGSFALGAWWSARRANAPQEPVRLTTMLPPGVNVTRGPGVGSSVALSPDGRTLVIAGTDKDGQRLYRRPLDRLEATPLAGTERGSSPFFSWDGAWVGFFADGRLKRVPAEGGPPVDIVTTPGLPAGASWGPDDRIVFAYGADGRLYTVDGHGGPAELLNAVQSGYYPDVLPDGRTLFFESGDWIHALDRATGRLSRIIEGAAPRYANGHIVFSRGTTLLAAPFDVARREVTGPVVPVVDGVARDASPGGMRHYAIDRSGTLAYVPAADAYALVLVDADGAERRVTEAHRSIQNPRFSPDGRFVVAATTRRGDEPEDLWVYELATGAAARLTLDGGRAPVWSPDGKAVTYSQLGERMGIYSKEVDGSTSARQLLGLGAFHWLVGWTPDRHTLAYGVIEGKTSSIVALTDGQSRRIVGPGSLWGGRLSRDGRWLAYYSLDSGSFEVYVTPFPGASTRWLIADGTDPAWAPDGSEMYYRSGSRLMAARIDRTSGVRVLGHRVVIDPFLPPLYDDYDIHPDGRTLAIVRPAGRAQVREVAVVVNWPAELHRLVRTR